MFDPAGQTSWEDLMQAPPPIVDVSEKELLARYAQEVSVMIDIQLCLHTLRKEGVEVIMTITYANEQMRDVELHVGRNPIKGIHVFEGYPVVLEWLQNFIADLEILS